MINDKKIRDIVLDNKDIITKRFCNFNVYLNNISMKEIVEMNESDAIIHFNHVQNNFNTFLKLYNIECIHANWKLFKLDSERVDKLISNKLSAREQEYLFYENNTKYIFCTNNEIMSFLNLKRGISEKYFYEGSLFFENYISEIDILCDIFGLAVSDTILYDLETKLIELCFTTNK